MRCSGSRILLASTLLALAACSGGSDPSPPGGSAGGGDSITGRERIGWTQTAATPAELSTYRYALYIDNDRLVIEGESCTITAAGASADCTAPLPPLGAGRHTLALAAFFTAGDTIVEGERSTALQVTVGGPAASDGTIVEGGEFQSSDGVDLRADVLVRDLIKPVDLAVAGDGRVFVAERDGRVRVIDQDQAIPDARDNVLIELGETPGPGGAVLLSVALPPDFDATGFLHLAYSAPHRGAHALNVVRFREVRGLLGQPAIVSSYAVPSGDVPVIVRFSPDGRLHVAIGTGPDGSASQDLTSVSGKILRIHADGTTPEDNRAATPVLSYGHWHPRGLAWLPQDHSLWEVEHDRGVDEINRIQSGANFGASLAAAGVEMPDVRRPSFVLEAASDVSGLASLRLRESPFFGDLIVSTGAGRDLLRFRVEDNGQPRLIGRLLQGRFGRIRQVAGGPDGSLYFITANQGESGPSGEALVRVSARVRTRHEPLN